MKVFDWTSERFKAQSPERQKFYKESFNKPISEEEFVRIVQNWPRRKPRAHMRRKPSQSRRDYKYLVETFGFFQAT